MLSVNKSGMVLQNPMASEAEKYKGLPLMSYKIIGVITRNREFSTTGHIWAVKEERCYGKKYRDDTNDAKLRGIVDDQGKLNKRLFLCDNHTGTWMNIRGTMENDTLLSAR